MSPYTEGYFAYMQGIYEDENPYWFGTWEYKEWMQGYFHAEEDIDGFIL